MPPAIDAQIKDQVIKEWLSGNTRDEIATKNGIGAGTVTNIINEWKKGVENSEYDSVRELAVYSKKQGFGLSHIASSTLLNNYIQKLGSNQDQIESLIKNLANSPGPEMLIEVANQVARLSISESIPLDDLENHVKQRNGEKQRLEEEIKHRRAILESPNVEIQIIDEYKQLKSESKLRARKKMAEYQLLLQQQKKTMKVDGSRKSNLKAFIPHGSNVISKLDIKRVFTDKITIASVIGSLALLSVIPYPAIVYAITVTGTVNVAATCGVAIASGSPINYGTLTDVAQISAEQILGLSNTGRKAETVNTQGTAWTSGGTTIMTVGDTHYSASAGSYGSKTALTGTDAALTTLGNLVTANTFWQLQLNLLNPDFVGTPTQTVTLTGVC